MAFLSISLLFSLLPFTTPVLQFLRNNTKRGCCYPITDFASVLGYYLAEMRNSIKNIFFSVQSFFCSVISFSTIGSFHVKESYRYYVYTQGEVRSPPKWKQKQTREGCAFQFVEIQFAFVYIFRTAWKFLIKTPIKVSIKALRHPYI